MREICVSTGNYSTLFRNYIHFQKGRRWCGDIQMYEFSQFYLMKSILHPDF